MPSDFNTPYGIGLEIRHKNAPLKHSPAPFHFKDKKLSGKKTPYTPIVLHSATK